MPATAFVSFSGQDSNFAQKLLSALARQDIVAWDYSRDGDRIAPGTNISDECRRRIEEAQYFLAVISAYSCSAEHGHYPQLETRYALDLRRETGGKPVVVPVVDSAHPIPELAGAYLELAGILRLSMNSASQESVDEAVRRFSIETVGAAYQPSFPMDPRIRLIEGFREEYEAFERKHPADMPFSRAEYADLVRSMEQFSRKVGCDPPEWKKALVAIGHAFSILEDCHCDAEFYFPLIMQGLCELELGRLDDASGSFSRADSHERAASDAHSLTGLALVAWRKQDYGSALEYLKRAERRCSEQIPWELRFNIVCAALASNAPLRFSEDLLKVDRSLLTHEDDAKYTTLLGIYLLQQGRREEAKRELMRAVARCEGLGDESPITWLAECLVQLGESQAAIQLLAKQGELRHSGELCYRAARICLDTGDVYGAVQFYEAIFAEPRLGTPKYLIEYARVLNMLGLTTQMRAVCEAIVKATAINTVMTAEDHFYAGFAYYLLGNPQVSEYEHSRAHGYENMDYRTL